MRKAAMFLPMLLLLGAAPAGRPWLKYQQQKQQQLTTSWYLPVTLPGSDGLGHEASCASVSSDLNGTTGSAMTLRYWVYGYFSGANTAGGATVGRYSDSAGVLGEVKLYCENHPSATFYEATVQAYEKMRHEGR